MIREALILSERRAAAAACVAPATIWYFGNSYSIWTELGANLAAGSELAPVGDVLNRWAKELAEPVRNLDSFVAIDDTAGWAASGIGSRSPFETPIMTLACCFAAFLEAMEAGGRHVFVVADREFGELLYATARTRGWSVGWERPGASPRWSPLRLVVRILDTVRERVQRLRHYGKRRSTLKRLRKRFPMELEKLRRAEVVMVLWGRTGTFPKADSVHDAWFGDLANLLQRAGRQLAFLIQPVDWADPYEAIATKVLASGQAALMIDDAYSFGDLLRAAIVTCRAPAKPLPFVVNGSLDLTPVLRLALARDVWRGAPTLAHVQPGVGPLLQRLGMKPQAVVHLYEGQPWERSLRMSVRGALPEAAVIAVQHMPFPPLYLNFLPSAREIAEANLPDTLMVLGPRVADFFHQLGVPARRVSVGGALRFTTISSLSSAGNKRNVLCCVGVDWHESHELADKAAQAAARLRGLTLVINFNPLAAPALKASVQRFVRGRLPAGSDLVVEFSELGIRDLVASAGVVLYSDTNAAYEAFAAGCELIFIARDYALDYDKLPSGWATRCRSVDQIAAALRRWLEQPAPANRQERLNRLGDYLAAVDVDAFLSRIH